MISEKGVLRAFSKIKKQVTYLKNQNKELRAEIKKLKSSMLKESDVNNAVEKTIKKGEGEFITLSNFNSLVSKSPDVVYMLQHFHDMDDISITKKQFDHFTKRVDQLRVEAAELRSVKKQLNKKAADDVNLKKLNREINKLKIKLEKMKK